MKKKAKVTSPGDMGQWGYGPIDILRYDRCPCGRNLWKVNALIRAGIAYCSASCRHKYGRVTLT